MMATQKHSPTQNSNSRKMPSFRRSLRFCFGFSRSRPNRRRIRWPVPHTITSKISSAITCDYISLPSGYGKIGRGGLLGHIRQEVRGEKDRPRLSSAYTKEVERQEPIKPSLPFRCSPWAVELDKDSPRSRIHFDNASLSSRRWSGNVGISTS